jgi:hypothetical protein
VRWDEFGKTSARWEVVFNVEEVGTIQIQHLTVGNKCFCAGEKKCVCILHHKMKQPRGEGGGTDRPAVGWDDPLKSNPNQPTSNGNDAGDAALIGGAPNVPSTRVLISGSRPVCTSHTHAG